MEPKARMKLSEAVWLGIEIIEIIEMVKVCVLMQVSSFQLDCTILVRSDQEKALLAKQRQEELESQEAQEREAKQVQEDAI